MIRPEAVARLLPKQRWFGAKDRRIERVEVIDELVLDDESPPLVLGIIRVHLQDEAQMYQVLLADDGETIADPLASPERLGVLGRMMAHGDTLAGNLGQFHFGGPSLDPLAPPERSVRRLEAEQTNTSLVLDDAVVVKLFRRLEVGPNPDLELNRLLTNEGWPHVPAQLGEISYTGEIDGREVEIDLAIAQELVTGATDGWPYVLQQLEKLFQPALGMGAADPQSFVLEHGEDLLVCLEDLGNATASLHLLLSRETFEPELAPEPASVAELETWSRSVSVSMRESLGGDDELQAVTRYLHEALRAVERIEEPGMNTRVHGDYHLGQVMLADKGWLIIDFEGEPARSIPVRRAKRSPLRDVAGMLRSFSYAATATLFEMAEPGSEDWDRLRPLAVAWESQARERFVTAYKTTSFEGDFLPTGADDVTTLIDAFEIEKAVYEFDYERSHRPDWERIPRQGLRNIVERRWLRSFR